jgi:hypothetical protein
MMRFAPASRALANQIGRREHMAELVRCGAVRTCRNRLPGPPRGTLAAGKQALMAWPGGGHTGARRQKRFDDWLIG